VTTRRLLWGLAAMAAIFLLGSIVGGAWEDSDTARGFTIALWTISVCGAVALLVVYVSSLVSRRR
jgi:hypothetical protein